jgi:hypothetical protein
LSFSHCDSTAKPNRCGCDVSQTEPVFAGWSILITLCTIDLSKASVHHRQIWVAIYRKKIPPKARTIFLRRGMAVSRKVLRKRYFLGDVLGVDLDGDDRVKAIRSY